MAKSKASIANAYARIKDYDSCIKEFDSIDSFFDKVSDVELACKIKYVHARQLMRSAQYRKSIKKCDEGIAYTLKQEEYKYAGKIFNIKANAASYNGNLEEAVKYYLEAVKYFKKGDFTEGAAGVLMNIGITYHDLGKYDKSIATYNEAYEAFKAQNQLPHAARCLFNTGLAYRDTEKFDTALEYLRRAEELLKDKDPFGTLPNVYSNIGDVYVLLNNITQAEFYLKKSLTLASKNQKKTILANSNFSLGDLYKNNGQLKKSEEYLTKALDFANELNLPDMKSYITKALSELYEKQGNTVKAFEAYKTYKIIDDSLFMSDKALEAERLLKEYEVERKDSEIALLSKDNELHTFRIQRQQRNILYGSIGFFSILGFSVFLFFQRQRLQRTEKKLQASLGEKETLLKEIHHRVKNNLQLIISLLTIQAEDQREQTIEEFLYKGQNRVKTISLIHERLYRTENLSSINFEIYTKELLEEIFKSYSPTDIEYQIHADNVQLDIEKAIPLGLILNELVSNSLKHAFQNQPKGQLNIHLKNEADNVQLSVQDNGKGFNIDNQKGGSIGLQLVRLLVRQLRGDFKVMNNEGTHVDINFQKTSILS